MFQKTNVLQQLDKKEGHRITTITTPNKNTLSRKVLILRTISTFFQVIEGPEKKHTQSNLPDIGECSTWMLHLLFLLFPSMFITLTYIYRISYTIIVPRIFVINKTCFQTPSTPITIHHKDTWCLERSFQLSSLSCLKTSNGLSANLRDTIKKFGLPYVWEETN